ncbi:MAG: sensor histidine kinase [Fusicatenibacter sp.]
MKKRKSLTNRFLVYLLFIIVLSNVTVFCFLYTITSRNMTEQTLERSQNLMESNLNIIEQYFEDIDNIAWSIIYNQEIIRFMKSETDKAADLELLYNVESLYYNSRPDLRLTFYKEKRYQNMYSIMEGNRASVIEDYRNAKWYQEILCTDQVKVLLTNNTEEENPDFVHSMIYRIEDVYGDETVGYLKIDMDLNTLKERFLQDYSNIAGVSIQDAEGKRLFYDGEDVQVPKENYPEKGIHSYETKDQILSCGISDSTGWQLCMVMSKDEIFADQRAMVQILIVVLVVILLITILISNQCFTIITNNFKRLVAGMEMVKQGNLDTHVEPDREDEISFLIGEFNDMICRVNELLKMVEAKQTLVREAEIKALQQQINPHFINNIMETIMGLASEGMDEEVITVSECMSKMLRYNTHFENETTLRAEIEQIKNYVQVLEIRFEDRFEVFYDIDESCMDCCMVKFTLQPLVENAISHGFAQTYKDGILRIRVVREEDQISILIFDNGTGIPENQLEDLKKRLEVTAENPLEYIDQYKSLGILNVHLRLRMYYGEAYSIEVFSKEGKGTCFSIKIPFVDSSVPGKFA